MWKKGFATISMIIMQIMNKRIIFLIFFSEFLIHCQSFLEYASVVAVQNGADIIVNAMFVSPKYLLAIWKGVTSVGENKCEISRFEDVKITNPEIWAKKNLTPIVMSLFISLALNFLMDGRK